MIIKNRFFATKNQFSKMNDFNIPIVNADTAQELLAKQFFIESNPGVFNKTLVSSAHPYTWRHTSQINIPARSTTRQVRV